VEQQNFDQLCSLVAAFGRVDGPQRRQLIDSLCSSLTCLNAWIDKLLTAPADSVDPDSVRHHRSAYKAYHFFLSWISTLAAREERGAAAATASQPGASQPGAGGRGRKKKAAADVAGWDWGAQFARVVKAVAQALNTDLWALFRPSAPDEALLIRAVQLVRRPGRHSCGSAGQRCLGGAPAAAHLPCLARGPSRRPRFVCRAAAGHQRAGGPRVRQVRGAGSQRCPCAGHGGPQVQPAGKRHW
jgi:hypothetical protein